MAKSKRKYSPAASRDVELEMRRYERGTARSGKGGKGGKVKKPRAGDRHRAFDRAQEGREGAQEEIAATICLCPPANNGR
jgi:hypothetical protein